MRLNNSNFLSCRNTLLVYFLQTITRHNLNIGCDGYENTSKYYEIPIITGIRRLMKLSTYNEFFFVSLEYKNEHVRTHVSISSG